MFLDAALSTCQLVNASAGKEPDFVKCLEGLVKFQVSAESFLESLRHGRFLLNFRDLTELFTEFNARRIEGSNRGIFNNQIYGSNEQDMNIS